MGNRITGYLGTYSEEIYAFTLDMEEGRIEDIRIAAESPKPSFLTVAPSKKYLYAINELGKDEGGGMVSAFKRDPLSGKLARLNQVPSEGFFPCHVVINDRETHAVVSNYASGTLAVLPLGPDGVLGKAVQVITLSGAGPNTERQEGPHAHSFLFDRSFTRGFAFDLGTDRLMAYSFDPFADLPLTAAAIPWFNVNPGAGPRHGIFDPTGTHGYSINELASTVDVLKYNQSTGIFEELQNISALPEGIAGLNSIAAAIKISPDGNFVYTSNRGHDSIAVFKRDAASGALTLTGCIPSGGKTPRDFSIDPSGNFLLVCNQDSNTMAVFRINRATGDLVKLFAYPVPTPVCVIFS
ncbi:lactonase family protein [Treponema primitia]|uniref:lactonase family protein n=1 Tax=Treponema primitia TaxID=88058 RepID=UPI00025554A4|nr:lactonase family protein [Treponema primitia]